MESRSRTMAAKTPFPNSSGPSVLLGARLLGKRADRRVRKTETAVKRALYSLIAEKGYESITVRDILERADVGRSTFYAHFDDKEDVLRDGLDDLLEHLRSYHSDAVRSPSELFAFSGFLLQHVQSAPHFFHELVGTRSGRLVQRWPEMLGELVRADLVQLAKHRTLNTPLEMLVQFVVGVFTSLLAWWVQAGYPTTAQEVDAVFRRLTIPAIADAFAIAN